VKLERTLTGFIRKDGFVDYTIYYNHAF
jgi:hypothetical protein